MLSYLKSFLRPLGSSKSNGSAQARHPLHPYSHEELDQYPFPSNPELVRKARHDNAPKFLPPPDASVRDVRYFLYTLLTSKTNKCAKRYPEWVLETCMAWHGDGEVLRACDEQDLLTLCPYVAVADGIESAKHRPGSYVPIPARHMIGEIVARFVMDRKSRETGSENIQRRLHEERGRSMSSLGFHARPESRQFGHLADFSAPDLPQLVRRRSVQSLDANFGMSQVCPTPAMWMASKTMYDVSSTVGRSGTATPGFREPSVATVSPHVPIRVPSSAGSTDSLSPRDSVSSHLSSSTRVTSPTSPLSINTSKGIQFLSDEARSASFTDTTTLTPVIPSVPCARPGKPTAQPQVNPYAVPIQHRESNGIRYDRAGTPHANLPQRYAPRRPSGLRQLPIMNSGQLTPTSPSSQGGRDYFLNTTNQSFNLPSRPHMPSRRRRGSLASLSRLSIPERINEELHEMPNSPNSMEQQIWPGGGMDNGRTGLQGTVPQVRKATMRRAQSQRSMDYSRSTTPPLQRGIYHPSRTPSADILVTKSPMTLIEVIENKQRHARKPSRGA